MQCKNKVIPAIKEETGTISKSFRKYLNNIHQQTTENSHTGHYAHVPNSANVKVQDIYYRK
jgi:hypothetical protein